MSSTARTYTHIHAHSYKRARTHIHAHTYQAQKHRVQSYTESKATRTISIHTHTSTHIHNTSFFTHAHYFNPSLFVPHFILKWRENKLEFIIYSYEVKINGIIRKSEMKLYEFLKFIDHTLDRNLFDRVMRSEAFPFGRNGLEFRGAVITFSQLQ